MMRAGQGRSFAPADACRSWRDPVRARRRVTAAPAKRLAEAHSPDSAAGIDRVGGVDEVDARIERARWTRPSRRRPGQARDDTHYAAPPAEGSHGAKTQFETNTPVSASCLHFMGGNYMKRRDASGLTVRRSVGGSRAAATVTCSPSCRGPSHCGRRWCRLKSVDVPARNGELTGAGGLVNGASKMQAASGVHAHAGVRHIDAWCSPAAGMPLRPQSIAAAQHPCVSDLLAGIVPAKQQFFDHAFVNARG